MTIHIDPTMLSQAQARAYLAVEAASLERAEIAAALAPARQRRRYGEYAKRHKVNMLALADIAYPISADLAAMSDDDLLAALEA